MRLIIPIILIALMLPYATSSDKPTGEWLVPPDPRCPEYPRMVALELDELWSFVLRRADKVWVWLALCRGTRQVVGCAVGDRSADTCRALIDRLLGGGGELVTLLIGADAPAGLAEALGAYTRTRWPFVEAHAYDGGQPHYPLLVGVE